MTSPSFGPSLSELGFSHAALLVTAFVFGSIWGSFVNVVIYRVPRDISVVTPRSRCPACGAPIAARDNVPILSWLWLRGRARCCGAPISPRYAVVEFLSGMLSVAIAELVLGTVSGHAPAVYVASLYLSSFILGMSLLAAAFIDAQHMYLPDVFTLGGTLLGLATAPLRGMTWTASMVGGAVGFFVVWLPLGVIYQALRGRAGVGLGDAKLVMLAGAWFGWQGALFTLFAGAAQATLVAIGVLAVHGKIEEPAAVREDRRLLREAAEAGDVEAEEALAKDPLGTEPAEGVMAARMPFGPFLCVATIEWMLGGRWVTTLLPWLR